MAKQIEHVLFRKAQYGNELNISRVQPREIERFAKPILAVMAEAYWYQFETEKLPAEHRLRENDALSHFSPRDSNNLNRKKQRMATEMKQGAVYWIAASKRYIDNSDDILGVIKTSPYKPGINKLGERAKILKPNCRVDEIAVKEPRHGIGSALLYVALSDYAQDRQVIAGVVQGSEPFFIAAGFTKIKQSPDLPIHVEIGKTMLLTEQYEASAVSSLSRALNANKPWLADAEPHYNYLNT